MSKGWECPKCGMVYGPRVTSCAPCNLTLAWTRSTERAAPRKRDDTPPVAIKIPTSAAAAQKAAEADAREDAWLFVRDCVIPCPETSVTATELYEAYCQWCDDHPIYKPMALPSFGRALADGWIARQKIAGRVRYMGIRLRARGANAD